MTKEKRYCCKKCGSQDVEVRAWIKPNENNKFSTYFESSLTETEPAHCCNCGGWTTLVEKDVEVETNDPWRCAECGSLDVEFTDSGCIGEDNDYWCSNCEEHTLQVQESELMKDIEDWFANHLNPDDDEVISGLSSDDFATAEEYDSACNEKWNALSIEEKIHIWHELTRDKSNDS